MNNLDISLLAASTLKSQVQRIVPDPAPLEKSAKLPAVKREALVKQTANAFANKYNNSLNTLLNKSIEVATRRAIEAEFQKLSGYLEGVSPRAVDEIQAEVLANYTTRKYFGASPSQRIRKLTELITRNFVGGAKKLVSHPQPGEGAKRIVRQLKGTSRGLSATRSGERFLVSEVNRSQAEAVLSLGENFGFKYYRWVTQKDAKVSKMDREREQRVAHKHLSPMVDARGVYTAKEIRSMRRHPYCRCGLEIVIVPLPGELPRIEKAKSSIKQLAEAMAKNIDRGFLASLQKRVVYEPRKYEQSIFGVAVNPVQREEMDSLDARYKATSSKSKRAAIRLQRRDLIDFSRDKLVALRRVMGTFTGKTVVFVDTPRQADHVAKAFKAPVLRAKTYDDLKAMVVDFNKRSSGMLIVDNDTAGLTTMLTATNIVHYVPPLSRKVREQRASKVGAKKNAVTFYTDTEEDLQRAVAYERSAKQSFTNYQRAQYLDPSGYLTLVKEENLRGKRKYLEAVAPTFRKMLK